MKQNRRLPSKQRRLRSLSKPLRNRPHRCEPNQGRAKRNPSRPRLSKCARRERLLRRGEMTDLFRNQPEKARLARRRPQRQDQLSRQHPRAVVDELLLRSRIYLALKVLINLSPPQDGFAVANLGHRPRKLD